MNRTGEKFITNEGYEAIIIEYNNCNDFWIQFQDKYKVIRHYTSYAKRENIVNPYHPSVCGVGCLGLMKDGSKPKTSDEYKHTKEYTTWKSMITRCYSERELKRNPSYKDVTVCDRWLVFANFLEDLPLIEGYELWIKNDGYALDKDLKGNNSKVYSLNMCCFISLNNNSKEAINRNGNPRKNYNGFKVYGINITTGEKTKVFYSIREAQKEMNVNGISRCIKGEWKTSGGYRWYKVEDNNN